MAPASRPSFLRWPAIGACVISWTLVACSPFASAQFRLELGANVEAFDSEPEAIAAATRFEDLVANQQWEDAAGLLVRHVESPAYAGLLWIEGRRAAVAAPTEPRTVIPLRTHLLTRTVQISASSPELLAAYRRRVDAFAEQQWRAAVESGDERALAALAEVAFLSRRGHDAVWRLAALKLRRGRFAAARRLLLTLHPGLRSPMGAEQRGANGFGGGPLWLALHGAQPDDAFWEALRSPQLSETLGLCYPDSDVSASDLTARLAWIAMAEGAWDQVEKLLRVLRRLHPQAEGRLGGATGRWIELLEQELADARAWPRQPATPQGPFTDASSWDADTPLWEPLSEPAWTADLQPVPWREDPRGLWAPRPGEDGRWAMAHHPIVVGDRVVVAQRNAIRVLDIASGKPAFVGQDSQTGEMRGAVYQSADSSLALDTVLGAARYTLVCDHARVFARLGDPRTYLRKPAPDGTQLVGLDLASEARALPGFPLKSDPEWRFEGSPVVDDGALLVAVRRQGARRMELGVERRDPATGELQWRTAVVGASPLGQGRYDEVSHHLLSAREGRVFYNTHHGVVAALDVDSGRVVWKWAYPRAKIDSDDPDQDMSFLYRDRAPCLLWRDLLYVAPADHPSIFALDANTGRMLWSCDWAGADAVHLHGIVDRRLVASGNHVYWIDALTGGFRGVFPEMRDQTPGHALGSPCGRGRGVLVGSRFYWPTRDKVYVFGTNVDRAADPFQVRVELVIDLAMRNARGGNLVFHQGGMLIAAEDKLFAFP